MHFSFTPASERAIIEATRFIAEPSGSGDQPPQITAPAVLLGLLTQLECRAAEILAEHEISVSDVKTRWPKLQSLLQQGESASDKLEGLKAVKAAEESPDTDGDSSPCCPDSQLSRNNRSILPGGAEPDDDLRQSLQLTHNWLAENSQSTELATEHVLLGLVAAEHDVGRWLREKGLDPQSLRCHIAQFYGWQDNATDIESIADSHPHMVENVEPLDVDFDLHGLSLAELFRSGEEADASGKAEQTRLRILRVIDAAANRASEGLRVVEDYARFVLDDAHLTGILKQFRHDLAAALSPVLPYLRFVARETRHDVGTQLTTASERQRGRPSDIPAANLSRLQESLRSLEEFGKLVDAGMAEKIKQLRYRAYTIERLLGITANARSRLDGARLYVLIDGRDTLEDFERLVRSLVESGVHVIQLRDKKLDDRHLLQRARRLAALTSASPTLFIMNDRPDLAALARAEGVHVGQEELSVKDARSIVGPESLIGVSTHSLEQARSAVLDGADYIGVGPVFPSDTKQFAEHPGVELLRAVAAEISLPAFAIGGIGPDNLDAVLHAGFSRIAVSAAVTATSDPAHAAEALLARLSESNAESKSDAQ